MIIHVSSEQRSTISQRTAVSDTQGRPSRIWRRTITFDLQLCNVRGKSASYSVRRKVQQRVPQLEVAYTA